MSRPTILENGSVTSTFCSVRDFSISHPMTGGYFILVSCLFIYILSFVCVLLDITDYFVFIFSFVYIFIYLCSNCIINLPIILCLYIVAHMSLFIDCDGKGVYKVVGNSFF